MWLEYRPISCILQAGARYQAKILYLSLKSNKVISYDKWEIKNPLFLAQSAPIFSRTYFLANPPTPNIALPYPTASESLTKKSFTLRIRVFFTTLTNIRLFLKIHVLTFETWHIEKKIY